MNTKRISMVLATLGSFGAVLACSLSSTPTAAPTGTSAPQGSGIPIPNVSLVIPDGLATNTLTGTVPADIATPQPGFADYTLGPEHVHILLDGYGRCCLMSTNGGGEIFVYPATDYAAIDAGAAANIKDLQKILAKPDAAYSIDGLPNNLWSPLSVQFAAQEKVIQFKNGAGVRVVTQFASDVRPVTNSELLYFFNGLTADGKYYIVAELSTNMPRLLQDDPNAAAPPGGVPFPNNLSGQSYDNYVKQITDLINSSPQDQFSPSLNMLDALVQSISIQP